MSQIGRYEILDEIGRGAMGVVFKARDPFIGRFVAVKTITTGIADNQDLLQRFQREAQAAGGLQHPNIVTIYEMSESGGTPFIAMEYLEGESLEKILGERVQMPLAQKLGYMVQICRALDYAHRRGVIHRDIKPANIVLTSEGAIKVVDFGIALIADTAKTQTGVLLGTISYMSPEQVCGKRADERCDIWALGVVFYELLTYHRPFNGENHAAVIMSILRDEPTSLREFVPGCPVALENLVQRALRKDESARYPTAEELLADLEPICTSLQQQAVHRLVIQGQELIAVGRLEEAGELLRQSLSIDTGSLTAKALLDQVNALLEGAAPAAEELERSSRDPRRAATVLQAGQSQANQPNRGQTNRQRNGTLLATVPLEPKVAQAVRPASEQLRPTVPAALRQPPQVTAKSPAANKSGSTKPINGGVPSLKPGAIPQRNPASLPTQALRSNGAPAVDAKKRPVPTKVSSPRPATPQPLISYGLQSPRAQRTFGPGPAAAIVVALMALGAFGYWKMSAGPVAIAQPQLNLPAAAASAPAANTTPPTSSAPPAAPTPATAQADAPPAVSNPANASAETPSLEDQQRRLIDLAHEAADTKDYKTAQMRLDDAAKLNGPLNSIVADLRHSFSEEAHGAELHKVAQQEQSLWVSAVGDVDAGRFDEAEKVMRAILVLPEGGHRWADAAQYVDEIIPERRRQEQLWSAEQQAAEVKGPESRINEIKVLDQVLAQGGPHQPEARARRDTVMAEFGRNNRRRNDASFARQGESAGRGGRGSPQEQENFSQLEDAFDRAVAQGDAKALEQMQGLRPQFMMITENGGPFTPDARDYMNSLIPKAQNVIEERLAKNEANAAANAEYQQAVKNFDQAVATQNFESLRTQVQAVFQQIASAGGPRAEEAMQYLTALIPAALSKATN